MACSLQFQLVGANAEGRATREKIAAAFGIRADQLEL